jgi:hypothetical protein
VEERRYDGRKVTDEYIDGPDGIHRRLILVGSVQR